MRNEITHESFEDTLRNFFAVQSVPWRIRSASKGLWMHRVRHGIRRVGPTEQKLHALAPFVLKPTPDLDVDQVLELIRELMNGEN